MDGARTIEPRLESVGGLIVFGLHRFRHSEALTMASLMKSARFITERAQISAH